MQFLIKATVFVARQLVKHQVGLVWNEVSRRYVDDKQNFIYFYVAVKEQRIKNKVNDEEVEFDITIFIQKFNNQMLEEDIALEMARMIFLNV